MDGGSGILGLMAIDPIELTRQLVNIESTTYHEGLAGVFLHEFLAERYAVERTAVAQPERARRPGRARASASTCMRRCRG